MNPQQSIPADRGFAGRLPSKGTLEYLKVALELLLLLLAVPWLMRELVKHPGKVSRQAAARHLKGA